MKLTLWLLFLPSELEQPQGDKIGIIWNPDRAPQDSKAQDRDMEIRKELAVGLASRGCNKFSQAGESLPQIKTSCPKLNLPQPLVPAPRSPKTCS